MAEHYEATQTPQVSILCPPPANVILTTNTFIHFKHCNETKVGLVLTVNSLRHVFSIRLFLSWVDVRERLGSMSLPQNVSFWPKDKHHPPYYLCETDIILNDVPVSNVIGLAFVFYDTSKRLNEI